VRPRTSPGVADFALIVRERANDKRRNCSTNPQQRCLPCALISAVSDRGVLRIFEALLVAIVLVAVGLGVTWPQRMPSASQPALLPTLTEPTTRALLPATPTPPMTPTSPSPNVQLDIAPTTAVDPRVVDEHTPEAGDAPPLAQASGTINILILGTDAAADRRYARSDTVIVASISPDLPSVSLLSFPRDLQVRLPDGSADRINTVFQRGNLIGYPGGGPAYMALVLRKNFGIKIDHFVRVDFAGLIKAVDILGGIEVLVECELHDTFPDPDAPAGKSDLDLYPGKVTLNGKQALWYVRSRWSTTDFDRARRQQKVLRAIWRKAREGNWLQNALGLYSEFRNNVETDLGPTDILPLVEIASRLSNNNIKSRVITWPIVRSQQRADGASILVPTEQIHSFIAEALAPPAGNQIANRPAVEVYNGSSRPDMELVAAERLTWEGFQVVALGTLGNERFPKTQIVDYATTRKGSPIPRLREIFRVAPQHVIGQPDPSSPAAARVILGEDYDSCPNTAMIAGEVPLAPVGEQIGVTPVP
jgi:LCP family protein required for cell wall assembly